MTRSSATGARIGLSGLAVVLLVLASHGVTAAPTGPAATPTGLRLLLIGLDGADWQIAGPLIEAGRLPNLAALRDRGAWTDLRSTTPMLSPLLWTSIATGKPPIQHGIIDFLVVDPRTGQNVPIASTFRKTRAVWNILSDAGRSVDFIGWWATWPAETINGTMVSDRFAYSLFGYRSRAEDSVGLVSPGTFLEKADTFRVTEDRVTLEDLRRFAPFTAQEVEAARRKVTADPAQAYDDPVNHLIRIIASTRTYHGLALHLLRDRRQDLMGVYFQGIDEICHRFAHYHPPKLDWVDARAFEKYQNMVAAFYEYQDELIGELIEAAGSGATVVVASDHGFLNGSDRPDFPPDIERKAGRWHRMYGVLAMKGPGIRPGRIEPASLYDLTPTLLYLSGLPVPADMTGRPIMDAVDPGFSARFPIRSVATYEVPGSTGPGETAAVAGSSAEIDEEIMARLKSLGYISASDIAVSGPAGEGDAPATLTNMLNSASLMLEAGDAAGAEKAARAMVDRAPDAHEAHALLSEVLEAQGRLDESLTAARTALNLMPDPSERLVARFAQLARRKGAIEQAKEFFLRYAQLRPGRGEPWLGLGLVQSMSLDLKAAEGSFLRALDLSPRSKGAVAGLFNLYDRGQRSVEILASLERAVAINPDSSAQRTLLGMIYSREGRDDRAERELRKALELEPERDMALAALSDVLLKTGRLQEARGLLERAVARQGDQVEVRMALGRVYAKMRRLGEATRQMSEAVRVDPTSASAHAQLGMILMMQGQTARSIEHSEKALDLDPGIYELHLHLAVMYHEVKRFDRCESHLLQAIAERPDDAEPYRLLASLYQETGRLEEAETQRARLREITGGR